MNIICDKTLLSAAIDGVSKAVTLRSTIPVLEGILLKAEGFQLTLTGYDLEMGIAVSYTHLDVYKRQEYWYINSSLLLNLSLCSLQLFHNMIGFFVASDRPWAVPLHTQPLWLVLKRTVSVYGSSTCWK